MKPDNTIDMLYQNINLERREIDLILCHVLNINTAGLFIYNKKISPTQQQKIIEHCQQRIDGMPFAYITGHKAFWTLDLKVNKHTLIPRPETEILVEIVLEKTKSNFSGCVLDLGTGTGAIALSIAIERPNANISAIDFSSECIKIAEHNRQKYSIQNVSIFQSHWFENIENEKFDIIVSNPPYIQEDDKHLPALKYEPISALTAKKNGLADLFHIIDQAKNYLTNEGLLMLEHGFDQQPIIQQYLIKSCYKNVKTHNDLAGIPRITTAEF